MTPQAELLEAICRRDELQTELDGAASKVSEILWGLKLQGTPATEIAELLGLSRQRVYQLLERAERDLKAEWEEREAKESYCRNAKRAMGSTSSGWRMGTPQCYGCRKILTGYGVECECGGHSAPRDGARYAA